MAVIEEGRHGKSKDFEDQSLYPKEGAREDSGRNRRRGEGDPQT
jgi:hypothetical protein